MKEPFLERRGPFKVSNAMLILLIFFFVLPSAFRGARLSLDKKENDVKDWLPSDFPETAELTWFARHFIGDSFVLATWEGCVSGDQRLELLTQKLRHESDTFDPSATWSPELAEQYRRAKKVGQELQLLNTGDERYNWAGLQEKWLTSATGQQYYITPDGRLYRWEESVNGPANLIRKIKRSLGTYEVKGRLVTAFGDTSPRDVADQKKVNRFYNDLSLICAPLIHSIQTGDTIVAELANEGGPLWPIDLTDSEHRGEVARRLAMDRLTGTLFAPPVPANFSWKGEDFAAAIPLARRDQLPEDFIATADAVVAEIVAARYDGAVVRLANAPVEEQTEAWLRVFDQAGVEPPPRLTCVLVTLTDLAKDNLAYAIGRGVLGAPRGRLLVLAEECGIQAAPAPSVAPPPLDRLAQEPPTDKPKLRMGGPPVDNVAIDEEGTITLVRLVGYSVLVGVVLSYLCFSSVKITIMVFIVGGSAAMLSMSLVWWLGGRVDAILMSMPSLVYVLGLSGAIHVINYYRDEVRSRGARGAAGRAIKHAAVPCFLASATTAIGLASLSISNLAPISNFGLFAALGVLATLAILFTYLPAALETFVPKVDMPEPTTANQAPTEGRLSEAWASVGRWITGHHTLVTVVCLVALVTASIGMLKIQTSVQLLKLFDEDSRIIKDYAWLEENFGKLVPMELVVRMPPSMQEGTAPESPTSLGMLERIEAVSRIRRVVHRTLGEPGLDIVGQAMSADTFLPPLPKPDGGYSPVRARFNRELADSRDALRDSDYLRIEQEGPFEGSELWRISLRVAALSDVDYGRFIATLRTAVEPVVYAYQTRTALLEQFTDEAIPGSVTGSRILILGSSTPPPIDALAIREITSPGDASEESDTQRIDVQTSFLATLNELLAGEPFKSVSWLDTASDKFKVQVGSEQWNNSIAKFDAVVWVGGDQVTQADLASAQRLVDARPASRLAMAPKLIEGQFPDVENTTGMQVVYTGVIPVVYKAQRTLLTSLVESIGSAFIMISVVMMVLLNPGRFPGLFFKGTHLGSGIAAGAISMIPNMFPILFVFGIMGHGGVLVDLGTMMTASVAMGVAVDDTIHFLSWFRQNLNNGLSRVDAVIETYRRVGPAMTQTTIVGGLGLFVFALSTFTPTQRFGTLMLVLLATALVGDLILLPAMLAGPLGRFFKPKVGTTPVAGEPTAPTANDVESAALHDVEAKQEVTAADAAGDREERTDSPSDHDVPVLRLHGGRQRRDSPHRLK